MRFQSIQPSIFSKFIHQSHHFQFYPSYSIFNSLRYYIHQSTVNQKKMDQSTTTTSEPLPHVLSDLPTDYPDLPDQQPPKQLDPSKPVPKREVLQCDAIEYLKGINQFPDGSSVVTSLPDVCEVNMNFETWKAWFIDAAMLILEKTPPDQVAIFYQTDIKVKGVWIDKGFFVQLVIFISISFF